MIITMNNFKDNIDDFTKRVNLCNNDNDILSLFKSFCLKNDNEDIRLRALVCVLNKVKNYHSSFLNARTIIDDKQLQQIKGTVVSAQVKESKINGAKFIEIDVVDEDQLEKDFVVKSFKPDTFFPGKHTKFFSIIFTKNKPFKDIIYNSMFKDIDEMMPNQFLGKYLVGRQVKILATIQDGYFEFKEFVKVE